MQTKATNMMMETKAQKTLITSLSIKMKYLVTRKLT